MLSVFSSPFITAAKLHSPPMYTNRRSFLAAAVAVLSGCGGGEEGQTDNAANTGQAEIDLSRVQSALVTSTDGTLTLDGVCASARHAIVWGDAAKNAGRFAPNRSTGQMPTANLLAFSTGPVMNESGAALPIKTNNYVSWSDAAGTSYATRLQSTGIQMFYLYRSSTCPAIPTGTYGLKFRCRSTSGMGNQTVRFGLASGLASGIAADLDWTQSSNTAATTFSVQFTYNGSGEIVIRLPAAGMDVQIDRLQLYFGGLAAIPTWADEVAGLQGGRKAFSVPNAFSLDTRGNWNLTANSGGGWILEPGLADHTYANGVTIMHACALDDLETAAGQSIAYGLATRSDARLGTTINTLHLGFETNTTPYQGQITFAPSTAFRAQANFQALKGGILVLGQAADANGRRMFVDEIPVLTEHVPFGALTTNCWHVGAGSNYSTRAHMADFETIGRHAITLIWDRALSNQEWADAALVVQAYLKDKGGASFPDFHIFSGDSNWTKGTGDVMQLVSADGYFSPGRNQWGRDTSVGGTGIAEVYGNKPYPAPMDPAGRFLATEVPMIEAALRAGRKIAYHLLWGTNDFLEMDAVRGWGPTAYNQTRQAIVDYLLAMHDNVWVQEYTIVAAGSGSGRYYSAAARESMNKIRRAEWGKHRPRHRLCDLGGTYCVLGDQQIADAGTYLNEPAPGGVHFNRAGDAEAAEYLKQNFIALRLAMHVPA